MILLEHTWTRELLDAVARANGIELMNEWVQHDAVLSMGPVPNAVEQPKGGDEFGHDPESHEDA